MRALFLRLLASLGGGGAVSRGWVGWVGSVGKSYISRPEQLCTWGPFFEVPGD